MKFASVSRVGVIALALLAALWASGSGLSEAQDGSLHNCPQASRWAIAVWSGENGAAIDDALATCGSDAVSAAYYLDPQTGGWLRWFAGRADISNLTTLNDLQGVIALGSPSASPAATPSPPAGQDSAHNCPGPGRWAISVWDGQNAVGVDQALASCGPGAVSAAYYLDPATGGWLRWFEARPDISTLETLNNLQGVIALASTGFSLSLDKFGEGTVTSAPGGIDCGTDCTNQVATYPSGTTVVLSPTADAGSTFSHWSGCDSVSGDSCTVQIDQDKTVFATFAFSEVKIPETTKVLDESTMAYLIRQEGSTYYFGPQATAVASLAVGDVIVSGVGEGLLRKVTAVNVSAEEIAVQTADATLEDVIERGTVIVRESLTPADVQSAQVLSPEGSVFRDMAAASLMDFNLNIDTDLAPGVKAYGKASFNADLEIAISFDGWDWGCSCFPVREAKAVLTTQNLNELGLLAEAKFSFSKEKEIAKYTFAPIWITVGPVPVGFFPELSLAVGVEGHAGAKMESKVTLENKYTVGVRYHRSSGWSPVNDYARDFTYTPPTLSAEAEARAYVAPELSVKVYGVVGPYFGLEGFLRLKAEPLETPWWSLYGGIGASAGFEVSALGVELGDYSWPVSRKEWLLAQADTPPTPTPGPTPSGRIAFESYRDGGWDIYVINADGSGLTRLTTSPGYNTSPAWSPDGSAIAFESTRGDIAEVYVMNADGSDQTNLTNDPARANEPAWSPDGSKIAFGSYRDGNWEVYVMNAGGSDQINVTNNPAQDSDHVWSPDGSKILFVRLELVEGDAPLVGLYVVNVDGSGEAKLTADVDGLVAPSWSPDGSRIAFVRSPEHEIYVMNADGTGQTRLTTQGGGSPAWSPDGSKIVFVSGRDGNAEIYVMNADGSDQTRLTSNPAGDHRPVWSPDGSQIAFESDRDGDLFCSGDLCTPVPDIYVMNADGSGQTNLSNNPAHDYAAAWSP